MGYIATMKSKIGWKILVGALLIVSVIGVYVWLPNSDLQLQANAPSKENVNQDKKLFYPVRGLVKPVDKVVIYAKQQVQIAEINVREGDRVAPGQLLALGNNEPMLAKYEVALAAGMLQDNNANIAQTESSLASLLAQNVMREASTSAGLSHNAATNRISEAEVYLSLSHEKALTVVPKALRFIQDNKTLFSGQSLDTHDVLLKNLYGYAPDYFKASNLTTAGSGDNLKLQIAEATNSEEKISVSTKLLSALESLNSIYETSESEFYDKANLASTDSRLQSFNATRSEIIGLMTELETQITQLTSAQDTYAQNTTTSIAHLEQSIITSAGAMDIANLSNQNKIFTTNLSAANKAEVQANIDWGNVNAPFLGMIESVYINQGQFVTPGTPLFSIVSEESNEIIVSIPQALSPLIKSGQSFVGIDDKEIGFVDRIVRESSGSAKLYIIITSEIGAGEIVSGRIEINTENLPDNMTLVKRQEIMFTNRGPIVVATNGEEIPVSVIFDDEERYLVKAESIFPDSLRKFTGINF